MLRLQPGTIPDLASLREALQKAIELEHATIPPYLTAYCTLSGTGAGPTEARRALRRIAIQQIRIGEIQPRVQIFRREFDRL